MDIIEENNEKYNNNNNIQSNKDKILEENDIDLDILNLNKKYGFQKCIINYTDIKFNKDYSKLCYNFLYIKF